MKFSLRIYNDLAHCNCGIVLYAIFSIIYKEQSILSQEFSGELIK